MHAEDMLPRQGGGIALTLTVKVARVTVSAAGSLGLLDTG
jgi:hypothetical protein